MLRLTSALNVLKGSSDTFATGYIQLQFVRWRKPRWIPVAKSKIFKVPPKTITPEEEKIELTRLYNNYRTQIKSIRRYLTNKYCTRILSSEDPEEQKRIFKEDFARCIEINNKWNEEQKILREKRVAEDFDLELDLVRKTIEIEVLKQEEKLQEVEEIVLREKEHSKSFIMPENIDDAIEFAMNNPVDYNYAVDLNGEKIFGHEDNADVKQKASTNQ